MSGDESATQREFKAVKGQFKAPFKEAQSFFKRKLNLPSEHWDDILKGAHDRAFVIAGATKADLLSDFRRAVEKARDEGKSIQWFVKEFHSIVQQHGWEGWTGSDTAQGRDWRARVIYKTNMSMSYAAGRNAQLNDPDLLKLRPYRRWVHNDLVRFPRPLHKLWNNLVLRHDDPWLETHPAPCGFGCQCYIESAGEADYTGQKPPDDGTYEYTDRFNNVHVLPNGVQYGFDYQPGAASAKPFKQLIDDKLICFPARIGADMWQSLKPALQTENRLAWHDTLSSWHADPVPRGRMALVGAIAPEVVETLGSKGVTPASAEIVMIDKLVLGPKQRRHEADQNGLAESEWRQLPALLESSDVYLDKNSGKLIYLLHGENSAIQSAVELDYRLKKTKDVLNTVVSGYRVSQEQVAERVKRGDWELLK